MHNMIDVIAEMINFLTTLRILLFDQREVGFEL
jgi:hypothetical protein